jgi:hypothetical protein
VTRRLKTRRVDRAQAGTYLHTACGFRADAEAPVVCVASDTDRAAVKALRYVLQREDEVSYTTTLVRPDDAARVLERLQQFGDRAEGRYEELA